MLEMFYVLTYSTKLSEFCSKENPGTTVSITEFDIPFQSCQIHDFTNIHISSTYSIVKLYFKTYRSLKVSNGLKLTINNVISGDILDWIDVYDGTLELNLDKNVFEISGNVRVDKQQGGKLIVHNGSFRSQRQHLIRIIHTNDIHCSLEPDDGKYIGWARFVHYIKEERKKAEKEGYTVLVMDGGDYVQGMPLCIVSNGTTGFEAIKRTNYDVLTIGNHFWDYGHKIAVDGYTMLKEAGINVICANIDDQTPDEKHIDLPPYIIKEVNGLKIGIFGLTTPYTRVVGNPQAIKHVTFRDDLVKLSQEMVHELKNEKNCDIVIMLGHLGVNMIEYSSNDLAKDYDGIDLIVDGHSHSQLDNGIKVLHNDYQTMIVQAWCYLGAIGVADLLVDLPNKRVIGKRAKLLLWNDMKDSPEDSEAAAFITEKRENANEYLNQVVGYSNVFLPYDKSETRKFGNSTVGKFCAYAFRKISNADFALTNGGNIRSFIPSGPITIGHLLSISPFGDQLNLLRVTGAKLKEIVAFGTRVHGNTEIGGYSIISGLEYTLDDSYEYPNENRIKNMKKIDNEGNFVENIDPEKEYTIILSEYLYQGGDDYGLLKDLELIQQFPSYLETYKNLLSSLPNKTLTGKEPFFNTVKVNVINSKKVLRLYDDHDIVPIPENENNVIIEDSFDLSNIEYHSNDENGLWKPFFRYSASANNIISKNLNLIKSVTNNNSINYLNVNGFYYSTNNDFSIEGNYINDVINVNVNSSIKCNGLFKHLNNKLECVTNTGFLITFIVVIILTIRMKKAMKTLIKEEDSNSIPLNNI